MTDPARPAGALAPAHLALFVGVNLLWGLNIVVARHGVEALPPVLFCLLRFVVLALVLAPFLRLKRGQMRWLVVAALTGGGLQFAVLFTGLARSGSVASVAIASQLGVPFATLLSIAFLGERVRWRRWTGIGLALAGVLVMGFDPAVFDSLDGLLLVVLAAFLGAVGLVTLKRLEGVQPMELQAWYAWLSLPALLPLTLVLEDGQWAAMQAAPASAWWALAYTAVASSLVAHTGFLWLLQRYPVTSVAPLTVLSPLFGVAFSVLLLGEALDWRIVAGGLMTLAGVVIIVMRERTLVDTGT